jgi:enoyl-CoA hydratase
VSPFVELRFEGPLARLTLKRADKLNALDRAMIDALADAARAIDASSEARVAILSGEGKAFCAGGDIGAWGASLPSRCGATGRARAIAPSKRLRACVFRSSPR